MAVQNLVSASISPETKGEILAALAQVRSKLGFLLNLQSTEVAGLFKAGKEFVPFIDGCHGVAKSHPEILSGVFEKTEFDQDYQLAQDLGEIAEVLAQLNEGVTHTLTAVRSDALVAALDVYSAVKMNKSRVPGLNSVADTLGRYFQQLLGELLDFRMTGLRGSDLGSLDFLFRFRGSCRGGGFFVQGT